VNVLSSHRVLFVVTPQIDFDEFLDMWAKKEEAENGDVLKAVPTKNADKPDLPPGAKVAPKQA
jgi:hypothetical protein